jgi:PAS domain-containing protein
MVHNQRWRAVHANAALRASEERRELAERATGVGVFDWDLVTDQMVWSAEIYRLHGLDPDTPPTHEAWRAAVHPDDRVPIQAAVAAMKDAARRGDVTRSTARGQLRYYGPKAG